MLARLCCPTEWEQCERPSMGTLYSPEHQMLHHYLTMHMDDITFYLKLTPSL